MGQASAVGAPNPPLAGWLGRWGCHRSGCGKEAGSERQAIKSHEARRKTRRCPEFKHGTSATPGPQLPAGAENPANTVGSRSCVGGTISAGRDSCCRLAAEPGSGPALRALPAAGTGGGAGGGGRDGRCRRGAEPPPRIRPPPAKSAGPGAAPGRAERSPLRRPSGGTGALAAPPTPRGSALRMAPAPRTRTAPAAGGATFAFPGDPSSRPPRVLKCLSSGRDVWNRKSEAIRPEKTDTQREKRSISICLNALLQKVSSLYIGNSPCVFDDFSFGSKASCGSCFILCSHKDTDRRDGHREISSVVLCLKMGKHKHLSHRQAESSSIVGKVSWRERQSRK
ncbi:uncharacterized protein [Taeniopygia guttata]|uniref:uncharacterized protein n=1 Tax=Taeniopygia guttata TaxID=59729 RepID=UPI003BB97FC2